MSDLINFYDALGKEEDEKGGFASIGLSALKVLGTPDIYDALSLVPDSLREATEKDYERGLKLCESPIEEIILPWLLCQKYNSFVQRPCVLLPGESERLQPYTVAVVPQLVVGNRRADFALAARRGGPIRFVIVECDGAAFRQDVNKDIARDAELMRRRQILDVHPITGGEIKRDPTGAAKTASRALTDAWSRKNKANDWKFA